jgi:hypothetical protein
MKHLLALVFLLFVLVPVMAQDVPAEPTNQVVDVIDGTGEGDTVTCESGATCNVEDGNDTPVAPVDNSPLGWLLAGLGVALTVLTAISLGLQLLGTRARSISNDPAALSLLERSYDTSLPDTVKAVVKPLQESLERSDQALQDMISLVRKITDGVPESSKVTPSPASSVSSTGANFDSSQSRLP